jgi:hypothetical protein
MGHVRISLGWVFSVKGFNQQAQLLQTLVSLIHVPYACFMDSA